MADTLAYDGLLGGGKGISRRAFLHAVKVAAAGGVLLSAGIRLSGTPITLEPASLVRSTFAPHVGDMFHLQVGAAGTAALQLFKVRDLHSTRSLAAQGRSRDPEQNFSILFHGPVDRPLGQAIYRFEHDRIGGFELFIAPMRPEQDARYYEAIFNREITSNT